MIKWHNLISVLCNRMFFSGINNEPSNLHANGNCYADYLECYRKLQFMLITLEVQLQSTFRNQLDILLLSTYALKWFIQQSQTNIFLYEPPTLFFLISLLQTDNFFVLWKSSLVFIKLTSCILTYCQFFPFLIWQKWTFNIDN